MSLGIYALLFQNNKVYIGSSSVSCEGRLASHVSDLRNNHHGNVKMQRCYNKYGEPEFQILEICKNPKKVTIIEQTWIDAQEADALINFGPAFPNALFGRPVSDETKKKISEATKGKFVSEETRKKISEYQKGKHPSDETRKKLSQSHKGKTSPTKGKTLSDEHKKKLSELAKGNKNMLGKHHTEETKKKMSLAKKFIGRIGHDSSK